MSGSSNSTTAISNSSDSTVDDGALAALLEADGCALSVTELRDLVAGVLAAPAGFDRDAWHRLVCARPSAALSLALNALRDEAAGKSGPFAGDPSTRVAALRGELTKRGLHGFVVPRADEHQGEYVPARADRLTWLTGFTGSAGTAVLLADKGALVVDGRYTLQAADQADPAIFEIVPLAGTTVETWLGKNLPKGAVLGHDPWLHTQAGVSRLEKACRKAGATLVGTDSNPLDAVWTDQPPPPISPVVPHDLAFTGAGAADKRAELARKLDDDGVDAVVLTTPDSIAWLLNLRGADVEFSPLPLSFAVLRRDSSVDLFIDRRKLTPELDRHLGNGVAIHAPGRMGDVLASLGAAGKRVQADPAGAAAWIFRTLKDSGAEIVEAADPCALPKAIKNAVELDGARAAHRRDGAALTRFLRWLAATAVDGGVSEIAAANRLDSLRREGEHFRGLSFPTISGAGPNGAIVHYRVSEHSSRMLEPGSLYLVDSGAQYLDGTTDVTRTVAIGEPSAEMRDRFTRVLKGHIAIATARFPTGTSGQQLDTLARLALWDAGLDYDHGTGHGVGSYLGVHEGPQRISKAGGGVPLKPGMIVSDEPGYYKAGAYGIRIENLVVVTALDRPKGGERDLLGFEVLTRAPIDRALIDTALLTAGEIAWLDAYHVSVREALAPQLDTDTAAWLAEVSRPL